ncbi:mycothione reductase [Desertimonas flava]|uniref:mycothione reductase n=1 Tax=Desertimonas flava TaxID=2064846 RepID=UPI000E34191C|nr:mycothione reductase [Desertimonas flava]
MSVIHHDLVIIGSGSGNSIPGPEFDHLSIAIVEGGTYGGTCLNVGCIPTKMYVHPADLADGARRAARLDVKMHVDSVDWRSLRDRIFGRIDPISTGGKAWRESSDNPNVTVYTGYGRFVGDKTMHVATGDRGDSDTGGDGVTITADRWVIAAGGRAVVPDIPGLALGPRVHTSDTIMRIDDLPRSLAIIGGGYIAAEFAHVFSAFGVDVTQLVRGDRLLRSHDADVAAAFAHEAAARWTLLTDTVPSEVRAGDDGVDLVLGDRTLSVDLVLVATGRVPNSDRLDPHLTGVDVDSRGYVVVDAYQRTTADGIFALGDVSSPWELKHVANHEMRVVKHNLAHPEALIRTDHRYVPSAVFTEPQIAAVGLTEAQAQSGGIDYIAVRHDYAGIAAGWAREDRSGFVKLLADPNSGLLLGAHVIGPEAATVIQPLIHAMSFGQTAHDVATGQYWIHPALSEVVENALLKVPRP